MSLQYPQKESHSYLFTYYVKIPLGNGPPAAVEHTLHIWTAAGAGAALTFYRRFRMTLDLQLSRALGVILLALGAGYFAWDFVVHFRDRKPAGIQEAAAIADERVADRRVLQTTAGAVMQFLLGAAVVAVGSRLLVDRAVNVAHWMRIPPIIVGLTIVGIGTSMPELVTAVTSLRRNVSDLSIGNVLGANVANLSLIVGVAAVLNDGSTAPRSCSTFPRCW